MQVILHTGVHFTDEGRLLKGLQRNAPAFREHGVAVPGPARYKTLLGEAAHSLTNSAPAPDAREIMLDELLTDDPEHVSRVLLSHQHIFGVPKISMQGGIPYRKAEERIGALKSLFKGDEIELFIGLRNPATWLPAMFNDVPQSSFDDFMGGVDPRDFLWSDFLKRLRNAHPDVALTVWFNEDTPLIWGQIMREMAGVEITQKIAGSFDLLAQIMSVEGMKRFRAYLAQHPTINERQKRRVMVAFLDKYAIEDEIEEELDIPGWNEAMVDTLTETYDDDMWEIERVPGVTVITT